MATELKQKNMLCHAKVSSNVLRSNQPVSCKFNLCGTISEATNKATWFDLSNTKETKTKSAAHTCSYLQIENGVLLRPVHTVISSNNDSRIKIGDIRNRGTN